MFFSSYGWCEESGSESSECARFSLFFPPGFPQFLFLKACCAGAGWGGGGGVVPLRLTGCYSAPGTLYLRRLAVEGAWGMQTKIIKNNFPSEKKIYRVRVAFCLDEAMIWLLPLLVLLDDYEPYLSKSSTRVPLVLLLNNLQWIIDNVFYVPRFCCATFRRFFSGVFVWAI